VANSRRASASRSPRTVSLPFDNGEFPAPRVCRSGFELALVDAIDRVADASERTQRKAGRDETQKNGELQRARGQQPRALMLGSSSFRRKTEATDPLES